MLYQLPNGKTVEITTEIYFSLTDDDIKSFIASNMGEDLANPFAISVLLYGPYSEKEDDIESIEEDLDIYGFNEEDFENLTIEEKLSDLDYESEED